MAALPLELVFSLTVAPPGLPPADAGCVHQPHEPGSAALAVLGEATLKINGDPQVVPGMSEGPLEVQQIDSLRGHERSSMA